MGARTPASRLVAARYRTSIFWGVLTLTGAPLAARPLERRFRQQRPRTQGGESLLFADAFGLFFHFSRNPLREWNLPTHVVTGRRVLFSNLRSPSRRESVGYSD